MEKETKQRKPYQRAWCKLTDYSQASTMFAASTRDAPGTVGPAGVAIYESIQRMYEYGRTHPYTGTETRPWVVYKSYMYDPYYDIDVDYYYGPRDPQYCGTVPPSWAWLGRSGYGGYNVATYYGPMTLEQFTSAVLACPSRPGYGGYGGSSGASDPCAYCC